MAAKADLSLPLSQTPKTGFLVTRLIYSWSISSPPFHSSLTYRLIRIWWQTRCLLEIMIWEDTARTKGTWIFNIIEPRQANLCLPAFRHDKFLIAHAQGSGFLSEGSSWLTACMSEQRRFWRDCADAQARLNLRCSHRRYIPNSLNAVHINYDDRKILWSKNAEYLHVFHSFFIDDVSFIHRLYMEHYNYKSSTEVQHWSYITIYLKCPNIHAFVCIQNIIFIEIVN